MLKRTVSLRRFFWVPTTYVLVQKWEIILWLCSFIFDFILCGPVNNLSVTSGRVFLGWTSTKLGLVCLAQGNKAVMPVRLEPAALQSQVKHSTTEPLCSLFYLKPGCGYNIYFHNTVVNIMNEHAPISAPYTCTMCMCLMPHQQLRDI